MFLFIFLLSIFINFSPLYSTGTIIVLHGTGSAGKTSIGKSLQQKLHNAAYVCIDDFLWPALIQNGINRKLIKKSMNQQEKAQIVIDNRGLLSGDLHVFKLLKKSYETAKALTEKYDFVILDTIFVNHSEYNKFHEIMRNIPILSVLVYCSPNKLVEHVINRNNFEAIEQNRDIFSHLRNFSKLYKKSHETESVIDTISQKNFNKAMHLIITYTQEMRMRKSNVKEKMKMLQERFEQKFFKNNQKSIEICYEYSYDMLVNTGKFSTEHCVALILDKLQAT